MSRSSRESRHHLTQHFPHGPEQNGKRKHPKEGAAVAGGRRTLAYTVSLESESLAPPALPKRHHLTSGETKNDRGSLLSAEDIEKYTKATRNAAKHMLIGVGLKRKAAVFYSLDSEQFMLDAFVQLEQLIVKNQGSDKLVLDEMLEHPDVLNRIEGIQMTAAETLKPVSDIAPTLAPPMVE